MPEAAPVCASRPSGVFYGWWLLVIVIVVVLLTGTAYNLAVAFFLNWQNALHEAGQSMPGSGAVAALSLQGRIDLLLLPAAGWMIDRYGPRRVMLIGLPLIGVCALLAGSAPAWPTLSTILLLLAVVSPAGITMPATAVANHWFRRRRAFAIAALLFPANAAGLLFFPTGYWSGQVSVARTSVMAIGVLLLVATRPLVERVGDRPEDYGQHPDGSPGADDDGSAPNYPWREAVRTRAFWLLTLAEAGLGMVQWGGFTAMEQLLEQRKVVPLEDYQVVATTDAYGDMFTVFHVTSAVFVLIGGLIGSRMQIRNALLLFALIHLAAIAALLMANSLWMFFAAVALLGAGSGGLAPLNIAALGTYFGRRRFATLYGTVALVVGIATFVEPVLIGLVFDQAGDDILLLAFCAILALVAALAYRAAGRPMLAPSQQLENPATR